MANTDPYGPDLSRPGPTVLVVDDTEANAAMIAAMLRDAFHVTVAQSVGDALAELATAPQGYLACVLDLALDAPSARLHDTLERLDIPVVLVSGVEADKLPEVAGAHPRWRYLAKPFEAPALLAAIELAVSGARPPSRRTRTPPKPVAQSVISLDGADGLTPPDGTPSTKPGAPVSWPRPSQ